MNRLFGLHSLAVPQLCTFLHCVQISCIFCVFGQFVIKPFGVFFPQCFDAFAGQKRLVLSDSRTTDTKQFCKFGFRASELDSGLCVHVKHDTNKLTPSSSVKFENTSIHFRCFFANLTLFCKKLNFFLVGCHFVKFSCIIHSST